ncbi:acyclic terpene utilization AtuA family protein [Aureispira anguillae]|uniref:DUF1446 domain-containing protein n=1 Tax=Aureispira anguillae TaxID=2864201 RepID=A0A915YCZ6_9BACT|nr:acyclic terpene utilization AtuA family protein [Aureispira anguillae]BDS10814.1 DUF1446 domain-containing protein [Aureispira anguillae]
MKKKIVRIAGTQGFYGDSPMGAIAVAKAGAADYLMHDALAELTLSILQKDKLKDPNLGYARDIEFHAAKLFPITLAKGIKVVTDSGGLNPHSAAKKVKAILAQQGITTAKIAAIDGDDMLDALERFKSDGLPLLNLDTGLPYADSPLPVTHANVYIGAQCIKDALAQGADIILAGRVADPCLALGILAHEFDWKLDATTSEDLNKLANGIMVGHILECGGQASGGNAYSEWLGRAYKFSHLGYPIAHVEQDGSAVITKLEQQGGKVSRNTIREQLVYEIHNPQAYITPDVTVDFTQIKVTELAPNQVRVENAKGNPRPEMLKLCIGQLEGYMTEQLFYFSYPYAYEKAKAFVEAVKETWATLPFQYDELRINYLGINGIHESAAPALPQELIDTMNEIGVRIAFRHQDKKVGKLLIQSIVCLGLNGPPGMAASMNWGKAASLRLGLFPTLIPRTYVNPTITLY